MLKKLISTLGIRTFSAAVNLAIAVLLSQYLGPAGKGTQSIIITTISFILIFSNFVGGATLVYLAPRYPVEKLLMPSYAWTLLTGIFSFVVLSVLSLFGNRYALVESRYIIHVCVLSILNSVTGIHSNILLGKEQVHKSNLLVLFQSLFLVLCLLLVFTVFGQWTVDAYVWSLYISFGLCLVLSTLYIRSFIPKIRIFSLSEYIPVVREMFRVGIQNQVAHITQLLSFRLSYYVLEKYKGPAALGVYSNGISIAESIWLVAKSMALVQYSWVSNSKDRDESAKLTIKLVMVCLVLSLLILIPLLILPAGAYTWIFGEGFEGVRPVIWTLAPGVAIYNLSILFGHYFSGTGRYYRNSGISTAGLVVSAVLYFTLIPAFSVTGAGIATSISYLFTSLLFLWHFAREYGNWWKEMFPKRSELKAMLAQIRSKIK